MPSCHFYAQRIGGEIIINPCDIINTKWHRSKTMYKNTDFLSRVKAITN